MSNPNEGYAFITEQGWADHLSEKFPDAIVAGGLFRMIQYHIKDEQELIDLSDSLGFEAKRLSVQDTIAAMELGALGPFICYGSDVHKVVDYFNPAEES